MIATYGPLKVFDHLTGFLPFVWIFILDIQCLDIQLFLALILERNPKGATEEFLFRPPNNGSQRVEKLNFQF